MLQMGNWFPKSKVRRVVFHEITREAIQEAFDNPRELDQNLIDAQQARRILDRLVGYRLSPVLWGKVRRGLSAGRVQSVALRLIVDREQEIKVFFECLDTGSVPSSEPLLGVLVVLPCCPDHTFPDIFHIAVEPSSRNSKRVQIHSPQEGGVKRALLGNETQ